MQENKRLEALLQFHKEDPQDPFTRFALASEYLMLGDSQKALDLFEQLVQAHADYVGTYYHLGKLYESLGDPDAARRTYRSGIEIAQQQNDFHARAELQDALLKAQGIGEDD